MPAFRVIMQLASNYNKHKGEQKAWLLFTAQGTLLRAHLTQVDSFLLLCNFINNLKALFYGISSAAGFSLLSPAMKNFLYLYCLLWNQVLIPPCVPFSSCQEQWCGCSAMALLVLGCSASTHCRSLGLVWERNQGAKNNNPLNHLLFLRLWSYSQKLIFYFFDVHPETNLKPFCFVLVIQK